jgi:hypothetical protein
MLLFLAGVFASSHVDRVISHLVSIDHISLRSKEDLDVFLAENHRSIADFSAAFESAVEKYAILDRIPALYAGASYQDDLSFLIAETSHRTAPEIYAHILASYDLLPRVLHRIYVGDDEVLEYIKERLHMERDPEKKKCTESMIKHSVETKNPIVYFKASLFNMIAEKCGVLYPTHNWKTAVTITAEKIHCPKRVLKMIYFVVKDLELTGDENLSDPDTVNNLMEKFLARVEHKNQLFHALLILEKSKNEARTLIMECIRTVLAQRTHVGRNKRVLSANINPEIEVPQSQPKNSQLDQLKDRLNTMIRLLSPESLETALNGEFNKDEAFFLLLSLYVIDLKKVPALLPNNFPPRAGLSANDLNTIIRSLVLTSITPITSWTVLDEIKALNHLLLLSCLLAVTNNDETLVHESITERIAMVYASNRNCAEYKTRKLIQDFSPLLKNRLFFLSELVTSCNTPASDWMWEYAVQQYKNIRGDLPCWNPNDQLKAVILELLKTKNSRPTISEVLHYCFIHDHMLSALLLDKTDGVRDFIIDITINEIFR